MGVQQLVSGRLSVPNFVYASWNAHSILGLFDRYAQDVQVLKLDILRWIGSWLHPSGFWPHQQDTQDEKNPWQTSEQSERQALSLLGLFIHDWNLMTSACTRMPYGSSPEKSPEAIQICKKTVPCGKNCERDQRTRLSGPQIILGRQVMRSRLESNTVMT